MVRQVWAQFLPLLTPFDGLGKMLAVRRTELHPGAAPSGEAADETERAREDPVQVHDLVGKDMPIEIAAVKKVKPHVVALAQIGPAALRPKVDPHPGYVRIRHAVAENYLILIRKLGKIAGLCHHDHVEGFLPTSPSTAEARALDSERSMTF